MFQISYSVWRQIILQRYQQSLALVLNSQRRNLQTPSAFSVGGHSLSLCLLRISLNTQFIRPAQRDVQDWKKQTSIRSYSNSPNSAFSEDLLSTQLSLEAKTVEVSGSVRPRSLVPSLCYGCHTTLTSRGSRGLATSLTGSDSVTNVPLPIWVQDKLIPAHSPVPSRDLQDDDSSVVKLSRGDMRALIEDFLLPDS